MFKSHHVWGLAGAVAMYVCSVFAEEQGTAEFKRFDDWKKTGSIKCETGKDATVLEGEHQGGEITKEFSVKLVRQHQYLVISRKNSQGDWSVELEKNEKREKLSPLSTDVEVLNYDLSKMFSEKDTSFKLSIHVFPGASLTIDYMKFSDKPVSSGKYKPKTYTGTKRYFDTPVGRFEIPPEFEDISQAPRKSGIIFSGAEKKKGLIYYFLNDYEMINPDLVPERDEVAKDISLFACPNQYEGIAFSLYALKEQKSVMASCSELKSGKGGIIPSSETEIRTIRCWPQRTSFAGTQYRMVPELLEEQNAADIPENKSFSYWMNIHVPANTPADIYKGAIAIKSESKTICEIPVRINVIPLELRSDPDKTFGIYYGSTEEFDFISQYGIQAVLNGWQNVMKKDLFDPMVKIAAKEKDVSKRMEMLYDGKDLPQLDFKAFDEYMAAYKKAGFKGPHITWFLAGFAGGGKMSIGKFLKLPMSDKNPALKEYPAVMTDSFKKLFKDCIKAINRRAETHGIEIYYYTFDEIGSHPDRELEAYAIEIFKLIKDAGGKTILTCGNDDFTGKISPWLDVRLYDGGVAGTKQMRDATFESTKKAGARFFRYGGCTEERFWYDRYTLGFENWICSWEAQYLWNLHSPRNNQFNDFDFMHKDAVVLYNGAGSHHVLKNKGFIPTLQLEALRQGIDDSRYIYTLEYLIKECLRSDKPEIVKAAKDASSELDEIKVSIPFRNSFAKKDAWDNRNFDRYRWRIASMSLKLQDMLKNVKTADRVSTPEKAKSDKGIGVEYYENHKDLSLRNLIPATIDIYVAETSPVLDGKTDDKCWNRSSMMKAFVSPYGNKPEVETQTWICRDKDFLYFAFRCEEPMMEKLHKEKKNRDEYVWRDDCVEIFIDGKHDHSSFYQILVNAIGTVADIKNVAGKGDIKWNCEGLKAASFIGDGFWSVEVAVPVASVCEKDNTVVGVNLQRSRNVIYSPSSLFPQTHTPLNYADLVIEKLPFEVKAILISDPLLLGDNHINVEALSKKDAPDIKIQASMSGSGGAVEWKDTSLLKGDPVKKADMLCALKSPGTALFKFDVSSNDKLSYKSSFTFNVPEGLDVFLPCRYFFRNEGNIKIPVKFNYTMSGNKDFTLDLAIVKDSTKEIALKAASQIKGNNADITIPLNGLDANEKYNLVFSILDGKNLFFTQSRTFSIMDYN